MDSDIEQIHNILLEANLPSSINDLKNPSEEFVVNLFNTFLKRFWIDINALDKPTMEQQDVMSNCDDTDVIGLINLHGAMIQICDRIYIKDLCITDIISPGSKRIRKQAKFLANFILYATNKESEMIDKISEIQQKAKMLQDMLDRKNELLKDINDKALHTAKQLSLKEKYTAETQAIQFRLEKNKKRVIELITIMTAVEEKKQEAAQLCISDRAQALKLSKTIAELESEIVKSPEDYKMRLSGLEKELNLKGKERDVMQEACQEKKHSIEQQQNISIFIEEQLDKFSEVRDVKEELKKISVQEDSIKKQVEILRNDIKEFEQKLEAQKYQRKETEVDELQVQYEERLSPLRNLTAQLLSNKKISEKNFEAVQVQHNEDRIKLKKMRGDVKKLEEETMVLVKNYQDLYDNEVLTEKALWKASANE